MNNPLVSIVIPVYNGSNYLREAIDSALAQTYANTETLVVNDGSADDGATRDICLSYGNRIRYFEKDKGGVASALNCAIRQMRGDYFSWLSHDDRYMPNKIAAQIAFINRFELREAVLFSDYDKIDATGKFIKNVKMPSTTPGNFYFKIYLSSFLHGCTLLIPRRALESNGGFPERFITTQDYELWIKMCRDYPFIHQAETLIEARQHDEQGSKTISLCANEKKQFYKTHLYDVLEFTEKRHYQGKSAVAAMLGKIIATRIRQHKWTAAMDAAVALRRYPTAALPVAAGVYDGICALCKTRRIWNGARKAISLALGGEKGLSRVKSKTSQVDFFRIFERNGFGGGGESASGGGSTLWNTRIIRREIPKLLVKYGIKSILDIPCGDFNWMRHMPLGNVSYIGGDIIPDLVERNQSIYGNSARSFEFMNLLKGPLPRVDLIFTRDCLVHMPLTDIWTAIKVIKDSGATWLLTTTFPEKANLELSGLWRPLNLCQEPFGFPEPMDMIDEKSSEGGGLYGDKTLALWNIGDIDIQNRRLKA